jgi:hypothetical protein
MCRVGVSWVEFLTDNRARSDPGLLSFPGAGYAANDPISVLVLTLCLPNILKNHLK